MRGLRVTLISTYEMGRQPFGLASPAAWLREHGALVRCVDLSKDELPEWVVSDSDLVGFYLPMHTATRLAVDVIAAVVHANRDLHLCAYGLYAPLNAEFLRAIGIRTILGGEFEESLVREASRVVAGRRVRSPLKQTEPDISTARLRFRVPDRQDLPGLDRYAKLVLPNGGLKLVGYTEASRGCRHLCRHCPIVPVYKGQVRIVPQEIVLTDIARQVDAGAQHITFGDPDFFNGPRHAAELIKRLHAEFPSLTYDVTIKVEHLVKHQSLVPLLRDTGCAFVVSAVESVDDRILAMFDKGHTRADFIAITDLFRRERLPFVPTFVAFNPWIDLDGYADLLAAIAHLDLVNNVAPVQLAIRLLIPEGSKLLELTDVRALVDEFDDRGLIYRWQHRDARVDEFQKAIEHLIQQRVRQGRTRADIFEEVWHNLCVAHPAAAEKLHSLTRLPSRSTIPFLTEPWYC